MALITVLLVFAAEFYFRWGAELRSLAWFDVLQLKIADAFSDKAFFEGWGGIACILLAPVLILALFISAFHGALYFLMLFIVSCLVLFFSIGPVALTKSYQDYFDAMERGDAEAGYLSLEQQKVLSDLPDSDGLVRNVTRSILVESQVRYFGVIFWFVFLGPIGALFYRVTHYYHELCIKNENEEHTERLQQLIHWMDWAPARLTSILFLLTGDFANGFYRVKEFFVDFTADNRHLISETGLAALGIDLQSSNDNVKENQDAFAMVDRTIIMYLVVVAALTPLSFW